MKTPKDLRTLFKEWFYKMPGSRYNRFCKHCNHRVRAMGTDKYCGFLGDECVDAVRHNCPIPTAMVAMLLEGDDDPDTENQGQIQVAKGGTIVPPSKFHFASTEGVETQKDTEKSPRPHGSARMRLREETPSAGQENCTDVGKFWQEFNNWLDGKDGD